MKEHTKFKEVLFGQEVPTQSEEDFSEIIEVLEKNGIEKQDLIRVKKSIPPCGECKRAYASKNPCESCMIIRCLRIMDKGKDCFTKNR